MKSVKNPTHFRPSTSRDPTMVGRIWFAGNTTPAEGIVATAKSLAVALRLEPQDVGSSDQSLLTVLSRTSTPHSGRIDDRPRSRWCGATDALWRYALPTRHWQCKKATGVSVTRCANRHTIGTQRKRESPSLDSPAPVSRYCRTTSPVGAAGLEPATPCL